MYLSLHRSCNGNVDVLKRGPYAFIRRDVDLVAEAAREVDRSYIVFVDARSTIRLRFTEFLILLALEVYVVRQITSQELSEPFGNDTVVKKQRIISESHLHFTQPRQSFVFRLALCQVSASVAWPRCTGTTVVQC